MLLQKDEYCVSLVASNLDLFLISDNIAEVSDIEITIWKFSFAQWTVQAPACLQAHHTNQKCLRSCSIQNTLGTALRFDLYCNT